MKISPTIIAIPGWKWKKELLRHARKYQRIGIFALKPTMCHECSRHFEILKMFDSGNKNFMDSEYYQFYSQRGKDHQCIVDKVNGFYSLYLSVKDKYEEKDPPIITDDGCRLDGSNRMSILIHLSTRWITFNIARYKDIFKEKKIQKIRKQVIEYRKDKYGLSTWTEHN